MPLVTTPNDIEPTYQFELELNNGEKEVITVPRITTGHKFRLGLIASREGGNISPEDMGMAAMQLLVPFVLERFGGKAPITPSLSELVNTILDVDGDMLFGPGWRKKSPAKKRKGAKTKTSKK